jgi:undecaprenyl-diphosphatase
MVKHILLGIIQGLTEFFPVSSSAHLVIAQKLMGMRGEEIAISVVLHLGTVLALLVFFFKDILKLLRDIRSMALIAVVTVITGAIGVLGKDFFESLFSSTKPVGFALLVTGAILILTKFVQAKRDKLNLKDALILGCTQGIAIIPGISRSGMTISTLLLRRIDQEVCFKFSFLASIPIILGAAAFEAKKIGFALQGDAKLLIVGFVFSFLSGLAALALLKVVLKKAKFYYFGFYCIIIGIITILFI